MSDRSENAHWSGWPLPYKGTQRDQEEFENIRERVRTKMRQGILWHRSKNFQQLSLLEVAENLIKPIPGDPVFIPGGPLDEKVSLPAHPPAGGFHVYVSPYNAGALDFVYDELRHRFKGDLKIAYAQEDIQASGRPPSTPRSSHPPVTVCYGCGHSGHTHPSSAHEQAGLQREREMRDLDFGVRSERRTLGRRRSSLVEGVESVIDSLSMNSRRRGKPATDKPSTLQEAAKGAVDAPARRKNSILTGVAAFEAAAAAAAAGRPKQQQQQQQPRSVRPTGKKGASKVPTRWQPGGGNANRGSRGSRGSRTSAVAQRLSQQLSASTASLSEAISFSGAERQTTGACVFLLYLDGRTWTSQHAPQLKREIEAQLQAVKGKEGVMPAVLLLHERDDRMHQAVEFETFFATTPRELISLGLYHAMAEPLFTGQHRRRSLRKVRAHPKATSLPGPPSHPASPHVPIVRVQPCPPASPPPCCLGLLSSWPPLRTFPAFRTAPTVPTVFLPRLPRVSGR